MYMYIGWFIYTESYIYSGIQVSPKTTKIILIKGCPYLIHFRL